MNDQQIAALERKHEDDVACGEIETHHLASLARKTRSMGAILKAWGESTSKHLSTPISKVVHCKLYTTKILITAADLLNDRVLPFFSQHDLPMLRILTDRGTLAQQCCSCGKIEHHDYELYYSGGHMKGLMYALGLTNSASSTGMTILVGGWLVEAAGIGQKDNFSGRLAQCGIVELSWQCHQRQLCGNHVHNS